MDNITYENLIIEYLYEHGKAHLDNLYEYVKSNINKPAGPTGKKYLREVVSNRYKGSNVFEYEYPYVSLKNEQISILEANKSVFPEELITTTKYFEGITKTIKVNRYERNIKAKLDCLKYYGNTYKCEICGFKFLDKYGEKFKNKIHVHHIKPISEIKEGYLVDPSKDLIPVCPNCHMILHSKESGKTYTVEEVKNMICKCDN